MLRFNLVRTVRQFSGGIADQLGDAFVAIKNFRTVQLALSKISSKHVFHAFNAWKNETIRSIRAEGLADFEKLSSYAAQRVFNQHRLRAVRKHFNHWCKVTEDALQTARRNADNAAKAKEFDRLNKENEILRTQRMAGALRKMMNMNISAAWRQWCAATAYGKEVRLKMRLREQQDRQAAMVLKAADAAARNQERLEREVARLKAQLEYFEEETRMRVLAGAIKRMTQAAMSKAYSKWKSMWFSSKEAKAEAAREKAERDAMLNRSGAEAELEALRMQVLNKVIARMLNAKLVAAWNVWFGWYDQARGLRKMMRRMLNKVLAGSFDR